MRRIILVLTFLFIFYLAFTPPGVCPCWLMVDPAAHHPHFNSQSQQLHDHEYLLEYFQSQSVAATAGLLWPIAILINLQAASGLWRRIASQLVSASGWALDPLTPPPRLALDLN